MKYFTLEECIHSEAARQQGIDNTPTPEIEAHIIESVEALLDPLQEAWKEKCSTMGLKSSKLHIIRGYQSPALNKETRITSVSHCLGYGFDLVTVQKQEMKQFQEFCRDFLATRPFDQLISVDDEKGVPAWIHIGYKDPHNGGYRRQMLSLHQDKYTRLE